MYVVFWLNHGYWSPRAFESLALARSYVTGQSMEATVYEVERDGTDPVNRVRLHGGKHVATYEIFGGWREIA